MNARGVSLIELMVSVVIGLFLVLGATLVYVQSRKTADVDDAAARLQETARYAMSVLESDVRMAGYWGFANGAAVLNKAGPTDALSLLIAPSSSANTCVNNFAFDTDHFIGADNNSYSFVNLSGTCTASPGNAVASADTLTIRHVSTASQSLTPALIQVCSTRQSATLIINTTCAAANSGTGDIRNLEVHAYYVDQQSDQSTSVPSLRYKNLVSGPSVTDTEISPGVEDMQVQFGWNANPNSSIATRYVNPGTVTGGQIVAVRVWLLVRAEAADRSYIDTKTYAYGDRDPRNGTTNSLNAAGAATKVYVPNDAYHRLLVSKTIFLRNAVSHN